MSDIHDQVSSRFYDWEQRGRGWRVVSEPVYPEPPFVPWRGHIPTTPPFKDDGYRPTLLSSLIQRLSRMSNAQEEVAGESVDTDSEPDPVELIRESLAEVQVTLPAKYDSAKESYSHFFQSVSLCREPITFELVASRGRVISQFAAHQRDVTVVKQQLEAHFSEAHFQIQQNTLERAWDHSTGDAALVFEFGLEREFFFPLTTSKLDPFVGIVGALSEVRADEFGLFQVIFEPVRNPWAKNIVASVMRVDGRPMFVNAPELTDAAKGKVSSPLFAVVVRIALRAGNEERVLELLRDVAGSLRVYGSVEGNRFAPLTNDEYPFGYHIEDTLRRQTRRFGMVLNSDELVGLVHLPSSAVRSPAFQRDAGKTRRSPDITHQSSGVLFGVNRHAGQNLDVRLGADQLTQHVHIIGAQGTGKSTLLLNIIHERIENGAGVAVLDPHGDLVERILGVIPPSRIEDVVLVDPSDAEYSVGFNILSAHSELEKNLLASDLVSMFQRLSTSWGDQMDSVFRNAVLAFLESDRRGTLHDLRRFLIEPAFRADFLASVRDANVMYYWHKVFPQLAGNKSIGPVATRLNEFLLHKPISHMFSQPENRLDFGGIMDSGKIFLAKLSKGLLGEKDAHLLGTLLVSKFQQLAMARQAQAAETRKDYVLVIDEFPDFITPSMAQILSGARKYRLGLVLAHQELRQLQRDADVASAVLSNPLTRICFRVGDEDARKLRDGFSHFEARDLQNLGRGEAIARVERSDYDFNLSIPLMDEPDARERVTRQHAVVVASREKYATPRVEIEAALSQAFAATPCESPKPKTTELRSVPRIVPPTSEVPTPPPPPVVSQPEPAVVVSEKKKSPVDMGKGGAQHKAIQQRIKQAAEPLGFRCSIEKQIAGSKESIDVLLERSDQTIACEISITTTIDHEVHNVSKCLRAGIPKVAVICLDAGRLEAIAEAVVGSLGTEVAKQVVYLLPDQFIADLQTATMPAPSANPQETTVVRRGWTVKRTFPNLNLEDQRQREVRYHQAATEACNPGAGAKDARSPRGKP
jgi:hypothetical protein